MEAAYAFRVRFRLDTEPGVSTDPEAFETRVEVAAADPGDEGWRFFRNVLWRGEVNDQTHARDLFSEKLGVPVASVSFAALHLDAAYRDRLRDAIAADLDAFNADSVDEVLSKYLGSSLERSDD